MTFGPSTTSALLATTFAPSSTSNYRIINFLRCGHGGQQYCEYNQGYKEYSEYNQAVDQIREEVQCFNVLQKIALNLKA